MNDTPQTASNRPPEQGAPRAEEATVSWDAESRLYTFKTQSSERVDEPPWLEPDAYRASMDRLTNPDYVCPEPSHNDAWHALMDMLKDDAAWVDEP